LDFRGRDFKSGYFKNTMNRKGFVEEIVMFLVIGAILVLLDTYVFSSVFGGIIGIGFWAIFGIVYLFWAEGFGKFFLGVLPLVLASSLTYYSVPLLEIFYPGDLFSIRNILILIVVLAAIAFAHSIVAKNEGRMNLSAA